ncbi:BON domain-containing protein [Planctomycetes bacterium TBK1r]|uniref:BON domain-containing protein n=1 Tax=Stieleria magnilauensis TaxID=2527963 RepID=UPI0011A83A14
MSVLSPHPLCLIDMSIDSSLLATRIQSSLRRNGFPNIIATVSNGNHVQLSGEVSDPDERSLATAIARTTAGVGTLSVVITTR